MNIGPRVWKTGLAVMLALFVCQEFNLPSAYLAVIVAIVSMKSSVAQTILHVGHRTIATLIGGGIGIILVFAWEPNPLTVGLAVILSIMICLQLNLQEVITLAGISVVAVMVGVEGMPFQYMGERLLVTFIGLASGTFINLIFYPPRRESLLLKELEHLNRIIIFFYMYVAKRFFETSMFDQVEMEEKTETIRLQFEEVRRIFFELKEEIGYLASIEKIKLYEKIISTFYLIFERILGIYQTVDNRQRRNLAAELETPHYKEIIDTCQNLLTVTLGIQNSLCAGELQEKEVYDFTSSYLTQGNKLVESMRKKINKWILADENKENSASLMEISTICYEKEQIFRYSAQLKKLYEDICKLEEERNNKNKSSKLKDKVSRFLPFKKQKG